MGLRVLVVAAGQSKRFKGIKQLAPIDVAQTPLLVKVLGNYLALDIDGVHLVLGANAPAIAPCLKGVDGELDVTVCDDWHLGMGHSIAFGVKRILAQNKACEHLMIGLGDQVAIEVEGLQRLIGASEANPAKAVASRVDNHLGPPAIFPRQLLDHLTQLSGERGARDYLHALTQRGQLCAVDYPDAGFDIDTREDLANWQSTHRLSGRVSPAKQG